jgi:rhodanese-related sulfurtransferase
MKHIFALFLSLAFTGFAFAANASVTDISQSDLQKAIATKSAVILDVNGSESFKEGHIPGAVDFLAHEQEIAKFLPADKHALVVAYCGNEQCSAYRAAAKAAQNLGYTNVKHFAPGIDGWKKSGAPTEKG